MKLEKPSLRPYQQEFVLQGVKHPLISIVSPTGSGKSLIGTVIAAERRRKGQKVLITTSQLAIEDEFLIEKEVELSGRLLACSGYLQAREGKSARGAVVDYLEVGGPGVMLASHQALGGLDLDAVPKSLKGICLVIDEAHHAGRTVTNLGQLVAEFEKRGAEIVQLTATDYRTDTDTLVHDGYVVKRRTLGAQMRDGFAPRTVDFSLVPFCADRTDDDAFHGDDGVAFGEEAVRRMAVKLVRQWKQDGRPKLIIRVPALPSGAGETIRIVCEQFEAVKARVISAFGPSRTALDTVLASERVCNYADSGLDVMVGCVRVGEALDWKHCNAVYCLGVPRSTLLVVQLMGRTMRPKDRHCPTSWRNRSAIRFFIPTSQEINWDTLSRQQAWSALMVCCAVELNSNASLYVAMSQHRRPDYQVPSVERQDREPIDVELTRPRGIYLAALAAQRIAAEELGRQPTSRELTKILSADLYGFSKPEIKSVLDMYFREPGDRADDYTVVPWYLSGQQDSALWSIASELLPSILAARVADRVLELTSQRMASMAKKVADVLAGPVFATMSRSRQYSGLSRKRAKRR